MLHRTRTWAHFALILIVVLLSTSIVFAQDTKPAAVGIRPDAPTYAVHGPYWVGTRDFVIDEGTESALTITLWYPALNAKGVKEDVTYKIEDKSYIVTVLGATSPLTVLGHAIQDAAPDTTQAPYPLIIFAPGGAMYRQQSTYIPEHLASYGFVAVSFDPRGETWEALWAGAATRPMDVSRTIAFADTLKADRGVLTGLIDTGHIAVIGHSSGGWNALVGGGARMDFSRCTGNTSDTQQSEGDCVPFFTHQKDIAAMMGLDSPPSGMWPASNDPRVDAVVSMAPDGDIFGANFEGLSVLLVPTMYMGGTGDPLVQEFGNSIYEHLGSTNKVSVLFENAAHEGVLNNCQDTEWLANSDLAWACYDPVWDMDRFHDLTNHFATAFLLDVLKGDKEAHKALAPDAVSFTGITYKAEGF